MWILGLLLLLGLVVAFSSTDIVAQTAAKVQETGKQLRAKMLRYAPASSTPVKKTIKNVQATQRKAISHVQTKPERKVTRKFKPVEGTNIVEYPAEKYNQISEQERIALKKDIEAAGYEMKVVTQTKLTRKEKQIAHKTLQPHRLKTVKRSDKILKVGSKPAKVIHNPVKNEK